MINSWTVKKSGKLDILIFSFSAILLVCTYIFFRYFYRIGENFIEYFLMIQLILLPFTIAIIITPFSMLRKKKMVRSVTIDDEESKIEFTFFNKRNPHNVEFNEIAYQIIERKLFIIIVFYEKKIATRGHILYFEMHSLFSDNISTSWRKNQIFEMTRRLKELKIEEYNPIKQKQIIDYILK
jgi:hypothetical protein